MFITRRIHRDGSSTRTELPPSPSSSVIDWQAEQAIRRLQARARILSAAGGWQFGSSPR